MRWLYFNLSAKERLIENMTQTILIDFNYSPGSNNPWAVSDESLIEYIILNCYMFTQVDWILTLHTFYVMKTLHFYLCFVLLHSRATVVTRASVVPPSVVRRHRFLWNRLVDWHRILVTGTDPPYVQSIFFCFAFQNLNFWFSTIFFRFR